MVRRRGGKEKRWKNSVTWGKIKENQEPIESREL